MSRCRRTILSAIRRPSLVNSTPRYGACSRRPCSERRRIMALPDAAESSSSRASWSRALLRESPDHAAHRRGRKLEQLRDIAGGNGGAAAREAVDGLEVVLDRSGQGLVND